MPFKKDFDPELDVIGHPPCAHLRSKGMYVTGQVDPTDDYEGIGDGHCWCSHTQASMGPDNELADRRLCSPDRECYQQIL